MKTKAYIFIIPYLAAFVAANLLVKHYGPTGLWLSSFLLIPFDFVSRCILHELWSGRGLILRLLLLTGAAAIATIQINYQAIHIAEASVAGFCAAQIGAGIFYQAAKARKQSYFVKVNISDILAIIFDSIAFQFVAFGEIAWFITGGQMIVKFCGGLLWYLILFKGLKIQNKLYPKNNSVNFVNHVNK